MRKLKMIFAFTVSLMTSLQLHAGGSVIGNGAGLVESRFQYAYITLQKVLMNCLVNEDCGLEPAEYKIAENVADVLVMNLNNPQKFIFVTEKQMSELAVLPASEPHRVAMTGLTPDSPIYVNVNQLYGSDGQPKLDYNTIFALIFHEVGHQSGEKSHQLLDLIASKLRVKLEGDVNVYKFPLDSGDKLEIVITNFSYPNKFAELRLTRNESSMLNLGAMVTNQLKCSDKNLKVSGYEFTNGNFSLNFNTPNATFNFLLNVYCIRENDSAMKVEHKAVKFDILRDNRIINVQVDGIQ